MEKIVRDLEHLEDEPSKPDWLRARRKLRGELMDPDTAKAYKQDRFDLPVVDYTLLSRKELVGFLESLGGDDIRVILDNPEQRKMGGHIGMILVTVANNSQIRLVAETLVRQLRQRKLAERGVVGAEFGAEGSDDPDESWMVVDCHNYVVHILESHMREMLNLEALWTGKDQLLRVNPMDEDAVDEYVFRNPVPAEYNRQTFDWDDRLKELERSSFAAKRRQPVFQKNTKKQPRR